MKTTPTPPFLFFLSLHLHLLLPQYFLSHAMVLRLHPRALEDLGELTRNWMRTSVLQQFPLRSHSRHLAHRLGNGRLQLHNLTVVQFSPPEVHYQASKNSLIYMSTDGGTAELDAQWSLQSDFLLSLIRSPAFSGSVRAKIKGFSSDVSIKVATRNELAIAQCVSRFDEFQLNFGGSLAADLFHWFHRPLAHAMQSHVEETFCHMIGEKLLPWLRAQLVKLVLKFRIEFGAELHLNQWLYSIHVGEGHLDLALAQRLTSSGKAKPNRGMVLTEIVPPTDPPDWKDDGTAQSISKISILLHERTLQEVFSGAHSSRRLSVNFTSPFLRTHCPIFCIGKVVPQMRNVLGETHLIAVFRTNSAPLVQLSQNRIKLLLNVSFELYEHKISDHHHLDMEKGNNSAEEEEIVELKNKRVRRGVVEREIGEEEEEQRKGEQFEEDDNNLDEYDDEEEEMEMAAEKEREEAEEEGTLIRPKLVGVQQPGSTTNVPELTFAPITALTTRTTSTAARNHRKKPPTSASTRSTTTTTSPTFVTYRPRHSHFPIVRIVLDSELELLLMLDKRRRKLMTELSVKRVRAVLAQSQIPDLSQKTMDLMVEASIPFLENSVRILYRDGMDLDVLVQLPTRNESVHVEDGFIRLSADLNLAQLLQ